MSYLSWLEHPAKGPKVTGLSFLCPRWLNPFTRSGIAVVTLPSHPSKSDLLAK